MNKPISRRGVLGLISGASAAIATRIIPEIAVAQAPTPEPDTQFWNNNHHSVTEDPKLLALRAAAIATAEYTKFRSSSELEVCSGIHLSELGLGIVTFVMKNAPATLSQYVDLELHVNLFPSLMFVLGTDNELIDVFVVTPISYASSKIQSRLTGNEQVISHSTHSVQALIRLDDTARLAKSSARVQIDLAYDTTGPLKFDTGAKPGPTTAGPTQCDCGPGLMYHCTNWSCGGGYHDGWCMAACNAACALIPNRAAQAACIAACAVACWVSPWCLCERWVCQRCRY